MKVALAIIFSVLFFSQSYAARTKILIYINNNDPLHHIGILIDDEKEAYQLERWFKGEKKHQKINPNRCFASVLVLKFTVDTTYNDGMGAPDPLGPAAAAASVDHDWSHMTWGLATDIALGPVTFTPAIYVQDSFDKSVNHEDEFYSTFSFTYRF